METLTRALRGFRERYPGQETSWKRLEGWLLDHAPNEKRFVKALVAVPKLDLHVDMAHIQGRADVFTFRRLVDAMTAQEGLAGDLAEQAILVWFDAMGVQAPDAAALRGPLDKGVVVASLECGRCLHLALVQAGLPLVTQVRVESVTARTLSDLIVSVWLTGAEAGSPLKSTTWSAPLEPLRGKHVAILGDVGARVAPTALREIRAAASGRWWIEVKSKDEVLLRTFHDVEVTPARAWPFGRVATPALAAFVLRDDSVVAEIVGEAAARTGDVDARSAATKAFDAIEAVLRDMSIASSIDDGNVRAPRAILASASASPIERQLLVAACLEHGGMPPLLMWTSTGPALGLWTTADRPALTETDDAELVARLANAGALVVAPIGDHVVRLRESSEKFLALDLASARRAGVVPLESLALDDKNAAAGPPLEGLRQRILDRAALAANRTGLLLPGAWAAKLGRRAEAADDTPPRVQQWKRRLLDLTLNNPLLNSKQRATSLPLLVSNVGAVEDGLASGQVFRLDARPPANVQQVTSQMMDGAVASGSLLVDLTDKRVVTQAKNALRAYRAALDEGGVHTLFLALGVLEWYEAGKPNEPRRAPLLLVPVMIRRSKRGHYEIKKAESDTELNAALLELVRREHGVEIPGVDPLPVDHAGVDVSAVLEAVRRAIAGVPAMASWKVHDEAQIAILAFSGFRMWRDLDHQAADLLRHPLVRRLAVGGADKETIAFPETSALDDRAARDVLCPLEADGSQLTAVIAASEGKSFVLEGPPGTGKSQTIANLIAQCLASEKTVLFVSQKRAALEVVQTRLEAIGLGPFLLELHSKKASKPEFIQQLRVAAEFRARKPPREWNVEADALGAARGELNAVVHALHDRRDPGLSVFGAIGEVEMRRDGPRLAVPAQVELDPARATMPGWIDEAKVALGDLVATFDRLAEGWHELDAVRATDWPKARRDELDVQLADLEEAAKALAAACPAMEPWFPSLATTSADEIDLADAVLGQIETSPRPKLALLEKNDDAVEKWIERTNEARAAERGLGDRWLPAILDHSLEPLIARIRQWMGVFFFGWLMLFGVRWFFRALTKTSVPPNAKLLTDAEAAVALKKKRDALEKTTEELGERVGDVERDAWGLPKLDADEIGKLVAFAKGLRNRAARFPKAMALAAEGADEGARAPIAAFRAARKRFETAKQAAAATLDLAGGFAKPAERNFIDAVIARSTAIRANIPKLREWGAYRRNRDACLSLGLGRVVKTLEKGEARDELVTAFGNAWLGWWIDHHVAGEKTLASFDGLKQRLREERFASSDRMLRDLARHEILARVASRQPRLDEGAPPTSQAGILLRQFGKRAGFASPRQLFSECAGLIRQLKPCVLMSPQSVAQYLDPSQPPFDVVVFDEASQVPTHEAIGAIARGRSVVVVGDSKQLPPTSFFLGKGAETDEQGNDDVVTELDSILEECSASGVPSLGLAWHYRSKHPSLIAFSNARYYGGRLQVLPAARARTSDFGVTAIRVKDAVYDRGNTATNVVEAKALVAELVRRLLDPIESRRSIGVVTFSRAQQDLVEDLLEDAREKHPQIEPFFDPDRPEPLIVKNLENIQGDERDVILFSIAYGPDAKGRMTANMGPLGQLGGERRLNVAITRAREQLVVYVSFDAASLDLQSVSARGLHDLKAFLESAAAWENVSTFAARPDVDAGEVVLKRAIAARVEAAGHAVDLDVGVGRYRVDIAVRAPGDEGKYVLGIELDGAAYAATDTARDRDRLRWEVLGALGWRMTRVRALDWYEDRDAAIAAITDEIEKARTAPPPEPVAISTPPPADALADDEGEDVAPRSSFRLPYHPCKPAPRAGELKWGHVDMPALVIEIVDAEGPISERLLARRVGEAWSLKRAPTGLATHAPNLLVRMSVDARPIVRDGFFWPRGLDPKTWRTYRVPTANEPETRRELEDVAVEEIANAAEDMRSRYGEMSREDLARAVAKRFGFRGLTPKVAARVDLGVTLAEQRRAASGP